MSGEMLKQRLPDARISCEVGLGIRGNGVLLTDSSRRTGRRAI